MFGKKYELFRILGFRIGIDMSWIFLAVLVTWSLAKGLYPFRHPDLEPATYWLMGGASALLVFVSILFHELSHSVVARLYEIPIKGITLFIFGGVAEMEEEPKTPRAEFLMALAGPAASFVLAGAFWLAAIGLKGIGAGAPVWGCASYLALINAVLATFNLIPAFPLDGGRALRAVLWGRSGSMVSATQTAARIGSGVGLAFMIAGGAMALLTGNLIGGVWWFLIGLFLRNAAQGSVQQLLIAGALKGQPVRAFMTARPVSVAATMTLDDFIHDIVYNSYHDLYPVTDGGSVVGAVTLAHVRGVHRDEWPKTRIADVMDSLSDQNTIEADVDAWEALRRMQQATRTRLLVLERGQLAGIVTIKDMLQLIALRAELEPDR